MTSPGIMSGEVTDVATASHPAKRPRWMPMAAVPTRRDSAVETSARLSDRTTESHSLDFLDRPSYQRSDQSGGGSV